MTGALRQSTLMCGDDNGGACEPPTGGRAGASVDVGRVRLATGSDRRCTLSSPLREAVQS